MPDDVKKQVLRLEVDKASANKAVSDTERLNRHVVDLRKEVQAAGRQFGITDNLLAKYGKEAKSVGRHIDDISSGLRKANKELKSNQRSFKDAEKAAKQYVRAARDDAGLYGDIESRGRALTGAVGYIGGETGAKVERAANVGTEILASVEAIKLLRLELPELISKMDLSTKSVVAMSAAAVAAGAAVLIAKDAIDDLTRGARDAQVATVGTIEGLKTYYDFLEEATSEEARARLDQILEQRRLNELMLSDFRALQIAIENGLDVSDQGALDAFAEGSLKTLDAVGLLNFGLDDVKAAIKDTTAETTSLDTQFRLLVGGITDNTFAFNDAKVAAELAAQAEKELASARTSQLMSDAQMQIKAAQMTEDQTKKRLEQIEIERTYYAALVNDLTPLAELNEEYAKGLETTTQKLEALNREVAILNTQTFAQEKATNLLANIVGLTKQGTEKLTDGLKGVTETIDNATDSLDEYRTKQAEVDAERALSATREAEDNLRQRNYDLADHYAEMAELDADYYVDRGEVISGALDDLGTIERDRGDELRSLNKDLEGLARDHAENMYKITRDAKRSEQRAARDLDAVALYDAQIARKDAIEDENSQYKRERDEREDQLDERLDLLNRERDDTLRFQQDALRALDRQHQQERQKKDAAFREALRREDEENRIKANRQAQDYAREDAQSMAHYNVIEVTTAAHQNNLLNIHKAGMAGVEQEIARRYAAASQQAAMSAPIRQALTRSTSALVSAGSRASSTPSTVFTAPSSRTASTNIQNLNINVPVGAAASQNKTVLASAIRQEFERMITR